MEFTWPISVTEKPRNRVLAGLVERVPLLDRLFKRLPGAVRRAVSVETARVNERIVEHPWVLLNIGPGCGRVLDVGCCFSALSLELASLGFDVRGIDHQPYPRLHPNHKFVQADICCAPFADGSFQRVLAISTVEHIGLGHYGDPPGEGKDRQAVIEMHRLLAPGGSLMMSVPFGRKTRTSSFRVYDPGSLDALLRPFPAVRREFFVAEDGCWRRVDMHRAAGVLLDPRGCVQSIAAVTAIKRGDG